MVDVLTGFDPRQPPPELSRLAHPELFAWGWQTVNLTFAQHRQELAATGLRVPLRGLMLFLWDFVVQARDMHPSHLDTLLHDTGRLGTRGECSQRLRDAILALHYLGRCGLARRQLEQDPPAPDARAFFEENVLWSLERAAASWDQAPADARRRLEARLSG